MYKSVIGLEVHTELNTKSKMFSPSKVSYTDPNINVNEIDIAFPGTMPTVNKEGIKDAIKLCKSLNLTIADTLIFDRKNYYYPDLPKGFQITQMTKPIGVNGYLDINVEGNNKRVLIHQLHVEEDAASFDHSGKSSLINYNRVGVPLIEIVTEPCIYSVNEAIEFLETLRNIIKYLGISDADQSKGQIRCDVNVSIMKDTDTELGVRAEVKNINSFSSVKEAINYEIKRQTELLDNNQKVLRETRRYSETDNKTYSMRTKAEAIDYKYYVEPNIPPFKIDEHFIKKAIKNIPALPTERLNKYINAYNLSLKDAKTLVNDKDISDFFENTIKEVSPKDASNWITTRIIGYLNKECVSINDIYLTPSMLADLIKMINDNTISSQQAKEVFELVLKEKLNPTQVVAKYGMEQVTDENEIKKLIEKVLEQNVEAVNTYKNGKTNIFGYLVGMCLKESNGKANPGLINKILKSELDKGVK